MAELFSKITAESGGSTPWEWYSVTTEADNSVSIDTTTPLSGSGSYRCDFGGTNEACYFEERWTAADEIYIKYKFYLDSGFNIGAYGESRIMFLMSTDYAGVFTLRLWSGANGAPYQWRIYGDNITTVSTTTNFSLGETHEIELYWKYGTGDADGEYWIKIDDDEIASQSEVSFTQNSVSRLRVGLVAQNKPESGDYILIDDVEGYDAIPSGGATGNPYYYFMNQ